MKQITMDATIENMPALTAFVEEQLEEILCPMKAQIQISIAVDELLSNIVHYAYVPKIGQVTVRVEQLEAAVMITFFDRGIPYNPLEQAEPDTTLSAEERQIGGLGIYMVKKSMDEVTYDYRDGENVLSIVKRLNPVSSKI